MVPKSRYLAQLPIEFNLGFTRRYHNLGQLDRNLNYPFELWKYSSFIYPPALTQHEQWIPTIFVNFPITFAKINHKCLSMELFRTSSLYVAHSRISTAFQSSSLRFW